MTVLCHPDAEIIHDTVICPRCLGEQNGHTDYQDFLTNKMPSVEAAGREPSEVHESLFDFQKVITKWAIRRGRAAIFADTGLGKTRMQLEWARQMGERVLIVAPLGVAEKQTPDEAAKMGMVVHYAIEQPEELGIWITNYERLHKFEPSRWDAVVLDESSILKSIDGKTREKLIREWTGIPYRLCCTATPAPNDIAELANHAEFLGVMTRREMLATWFVHDEGATGWRLKGHAVQPFYRWIATWAMYLRRPSDIGFEDDGFRLPPLEIRDVVVPVDWKPDRGMLMPQLIGGVQGRTAARRGSLDARVARAVEIIQLKDKGQWVVWCGLNDEGRRLARELGFEAVNIEGSDRPETKAEQEERWRLGEVRVLITKPTIFGYGMNWQHCQNVLFLGLGDSFEQYYQAIRRCWRFGQKEPVSVDIVLSEAEGRIAENVWRKESEHERTAADVISHVADIEKAELAGVNRTQDEYRTNDAEGADWRMLLGDCVERLREVDSGSVGLSVHSPPFAQLYTYSASPRDMGNSGNYQDFFEHYRYAVREIRRVTMPGRRACVHVQQVSTTKNTHGIIGWQDFRGEIIRLYQSEGWIYDGEICIDKDPQAQAIRTKSKALLFVQKNKDSSWSRPAMADYVLLFRAPGDNPEAVKTDISNEEWILWARPIWYGIRESDTLQVPPKKNDEKHIAPLQLGTIERCVRLWSNKGDLVLDPMAGIGSTGYVALQHDRRFVGIELKPEYWQTAVANLKTAKAQQVLL